MIDLEKMSKLDEIEKIDVIDELLANDISLSKFISGVEAEEKRKQITKRKVEIRNYQKLAVASLIAVIMWQGFLCSNSSLISSEIEKNIQKIEDIKIGGSHL